MKKSLLAIALAARCGPSAGSLPHRWAMRLHRPAVQVVASRACRSSVGGAGGPAHRGRRRAGYCPVLRRRRGEQWRQVPVPTSVSLTAVQFVDDNRVGPWATAASCLHSSDARRELGACSSMAGKSPRLMQKARRPAATRKAVAEAEWLVADGPDKPFLEPALHGCADTASSSAPTTWPSSTQDGGKTWASIANRLDNPVACTCTRCRRRATAC